jgi:hypothetical protein
MGKASVYFNYIVGPHNAKVNGLQLKQANSNSTFTPAFHWAIGRISRELITTPLEAITDVRTFPLH